MNYFEHHIGDYDQATAHLTACEDGIYSRLIRRYMANEKPLPADLAAVQRWARAHSREEKKAVETVLAEFFELTPDGYRQKRCDEEIDRYQGKQAKAKASADARWSVHRTQSERNANASREHAQSADATNMRTHPPSNATGAEARARPQSPYTKHHTEKQERATATAVARALEGKNPENPPNGHAETPAGTVCRAMRSAGLAATNPGDPRLLALLAQGATEAEFVGIAAEAAGKGRGWAWVLKVVEMRRADAAAITLADPVDDGSAAAEEAIRLTAERASEEEAHRIAAMSPESHAARKRVMSMIGGLSAKLTGKAE